MTCAHTHTHILWWAEVQGGRLGSHVLGSEWWSSGKWKINGYSGYISLLLLYSSPPDPSFLPSAKWNRRHLGSLILLFCRRGVGCWYVWVCFCMHMSLYLWVCMPACDSVCLAYVNTYYVVFLIYNLFHCFSWTPINDVNWQSDISWYNEPIFVLFFYLFVCFVLRRSASAQNALHIHKSPCKLCMNIDIFIY